MRQVAGGKQHASCRRRMGTYLCIQGTKNLNPALRGDLWVQRWFPEHAFPAPQSAAPAITRVHLLSSTPAKSTYQIAAHLSKGLVWDCFASSRKHIALRKIERLGMRLGTGPSTGGSATQDGGKFFSLGESGTTSHRAEEQHIYDVAMPLETCAVCPPAYLTLP
jgi:hypothetical protein